MSGKFIDILYNIVIRFKWRYILFLFMISLVGGWWATRLFEPHADIVKPSIYWWYFLTSVLRGGDSGYTPATLGGRLVSLVSFFGGGISFIAVICKTTLSAHEHAQRRKKGIIHHKMKDHIVILGYRAEETESLVEQIKSEHLSQTQVVLCSRHLEENPLPGVVDFVKGDTSSDDVLIRASVAHARTIVISGHKDERALAIAIAANSANPSAHIIVYLENRSNERFLKMLDPQIECVTSLRTQLIAQAIFNPGSIELIRNLVSLDDPGTAYRIDIPAEVPEITFHELSAILHINYRVITLGYAQSHISSDKAILNPPPLEMVKGGMSIFYVAQYRIDQIIDWSIVRPAPLEEEMSVPPSVVAA